MGDRLIAKKRKTDAQERRAELRKARLAAKKRKALGRRAAPLPARNGGANLDDDRAWMS